MIDFQQFEDVFGSKSDTSYHQQSIDDIVRNRQRLDNELFVDRLLKTLGIDKASNLYPPRSSLELRRLHERVISNPFPDHLKQSILYYLRKEFPSASRQAAEDLAKGLHLPEKYKIFIDGLWYLDHLKFERALDYLTEPVLITTYPEEILYTLCRHAPENDGSLPLAYYHTVSPNIASSKVLEAFFLILCRTNIMEAFFFSRSRGDLMHHNLFEKLINFVLADSTDDIRARRCVDLISLPLTEEEENWFDEYLKDGKGRTLLGARDTLIARGLLKGNPKDLLAYEKNMVNRKVNGVNWMTFKESVQHGLGKIDH